MALATPRYLDYIDSIKGFAILLVVMGHVLAWSHADFYEVLDSESFAATFWWRTIYAFHMPLFFCVSGFLTCKRKLEIHGFIQLIWRRTYTLVFPFIIVGLLFHFMTRGDVFKYWFLRTLFEITIINIVYEYIKEKLKLPFVIDIVFYFAIYKLLLLLYGHFSGTPFDRIVDLSHIASPNYLAFCFGTIICRYKQVQKIIDSNISYTVSFVLFITLLYFATLPWKVNSLILSLSGIICVWYLLKNVFTDGIIVKVLIILGKNSLEIYLIHFFVNISIIQFGDYTSELVNKATYISILSSCSLQLIYALLVSAIICLLCLFFAKIIKSSRVLSIFLMGRKY